MAALQAQLGRLLTEPPADGGIVACAGGAAITEVGPARAENQDRAVLARLADGTAVAAVADGMGGMHDGGGCAAQALAGMIGWLAEHGGARTDIALAYANEQVFAHSGGAGGTTLSAVVVPAEGRVWLAHAGDSRVYALATDRAPEACSRDHNALSEQGADSLSATERAVLGAQITCALGLAPELDEPVHALAGEQWLLTSDGIHDFAAEALASLRAADESASADLRPLLQAARNARSHDDATAAWLAPEALPAEAGRTLVWAAGYGHSPWRW